jgi:hypothetical protein
MENLLKQVRNGGSTRFSGFMGGRRRIHPARLRHPSPPIEIGGWDGKPAEAGSEWRLDPLQRVYGWQAPDSSGAASPSVSAD